MSTWLEFQNQMLGLTRNGCVSVFLALVTIKFNFCVSWFAYLSCEVVFPLAYVGLVLACEVWHTLHLTWSYDFQVSKCLVCVCEKPSYLWIFCAYWYTMWSLWVHPFMWLSHVFWVSLNRHEFEKRKIYFQNMVELSHKKMCFALNSSLFFFFV